MTWLDNLKLNTVIVHTKTGMSFRGNKSGVYDDGLVLSDARLVDENGISEQLGGQVWVPRDEVHFMQIMEAPE